MSSAENRSFKVEENRVRRWASRQGFTLTKSRVRHPAALEYGKYLLSDRDNCVRMGGWQFLDSIEKYLRHPADGDQP